MFEKIKLSLKSINYRLFAVLLAMGFIPTIYMTVRIFFLGNMPTDWGFNIASQLSWVNLIYEVLQEAIILPLFYLMGKSISDKSILINKIKTGLIVTFGIYGAVSFGVIIFVKPLITLMSQKQYLISATAAYIRLEAIASILLTLARFLILVLIMLKKNKQLYAILIIQMFLTVFSDIFLVSSLPISFDLGVNGIAIGNIIVNTFLLITVILFLNKEGYQIGLKGKISFGWMKEWIKVGGYSGLESFVRNAVFMLMVIRMVNVVGEQGTFWVANNFIWGWLLLPILQLGQLIKRDCGEGGDRAIKQKTIGYFVLTGIIVIIWLFTMPFWASFIKNIMNVKNYANVYSIALISVVFYITFAFNNVIDSIFYGIGKTNYMLFQSIVINTLFYGTLFILYRAGIYKPTLSLIALMFGAGIAFDSALTYVMFIWMLKKRKISIM
ncbi:MAG: multidrug transporter [Deltaproteobacteria bacterium]|nr:multidrug transporter [Deltaproteobacteria bacterium]